jgi:polysaccharide export outer membrane protein
MNVEFFAPKGLNRMRKLIFAWIVGLIATLFAGAPALPASGRLINTNDVLQISVLYQTELNATTRVDPDGTINLPYAGRIQAGGLTTGALAVKIANILKDKGLVKTPQVTVELSSFGFQISVLGAVNAPGNLVLDRPSTLLQVLARAGGIREEAGAAVIVVHSRGKIFRINAKALMAGRSHDDLVLNNNDTIYVEQGAIYYLYGYVNRPGQFPLNRENMTIRQAIAEGGGISQLGTDWWRLRIRRQVHGAIEEITPELDDLVEPNDIIIVNERIF